MDVVPDTAISDVDGERNRIIVRGDDLNDLVRKISYEQMCGLLWTGKRDPIPLGEARVRAASQVSRGMGLKAFLASVGDEGPRSLTAALAVVVAREANPQAPDPDPAAGHAADFLRMATGSTDAARAAALETYLVAMAENGLNTSTFVARIVASTGAPVGACVAAAYGALEGPLHGGAPGPVLDMLQAIGEASRAATWVVAERAAGRRIPGLGHRIFKGRDPRATLLQAAVAQLPSTPRLDVAKAVSEAANLRRETPLHANVELYTAVLLDAIGLPKAVFTPVFAVARVAGWCAHIAEQRANGRLIQPNARYTGPSPS